MKVVSETIYITTTFTDRLSSFINFFQLAAGQAHKYNSGKVASSVDLDSLKMDSNRGLHLPSSRKKNT